MDDHLRRTTSRDSNKSNPASDSGLHPPFSSAQSALAASRRGASIDLQGSVTPRTASANFVSRSPSLLWPDARQHLLRRLSQSSSTSIPPIESLPEASVPQQPHAPPRQSSEAARVSPAPSPFLIPRGRSASSLNLDAGGFLPSSFRSLGAAIMNGTWSAAPSNASSTVGSDEDNVRASMSGPTTATSSASAAVVPGGGSYFPHSDRSHADTTQSMPPPTVPASAAPAPAPTPASSDALASRPQQIARNPRKTVPGSRRISGVYPGNASPISDRSAQTSVDGRESATSRVAPLGIIGICALDSKARSKPSRNILNRINANQEFDVIIFGDKVILDETPENWPLCDYLISFFSDGFPLDKAISYVRLRKPFSVNDLPMQMVLWDRRICLKILDKFEVPTPKRVEVSRDGGPTLPSSDVAQHVLERTSVKIRGPDEGSSTAQTPPTRVVMLDDDTLSVDGVEIKKPFVEKPVSGEDHNINIYYAKDAGGGGRRLFRKINNKSSEADDTLNVPRAVTDPGSSYIFEKFLSTDGNEDVKAYTVGSDFCHAETRKSPTVDGIVKRNTHGKEMRYVADLSPDERTIARKISEAFGQRVCGFDLLRTGGSSYVIDVNGWSFVKDNNDYYDKCASIMKSLFLEEKARKDGKVPPTDISSSTEAHIRPSSGHLSNAFKSILKSPSMSRLAGHHHQNTRVNGRASPDISGQSVPFTSPPSIEKPQPAHLPAATLPQPESLPPPAVGSTAASDSGVIDAQPAEQVQQPVPAPASKAQWKLKGMVAVIRHADRTPKQKFKFTFHSQHFVELLKGHRQEVVLNGEAALNSVMEAVKLALQEGKEDPDKLKLLRTSLARKGSWPGTKVQIKPMFRKKKSPAPLPTKDVRPKGAEVAKRGVREASVDITTDDEAGTPKTPHRQSINDVTLSREAAEEDNLELEKLQLIIKWGGEPTHSARYQAQELGENMRNDLLLMNRDALDDLKVYSSSERRVTTSANIWTSAFLDQQVVPPDYVEIRKALLDDSNAAKDEMDKVKKKLKGLLREGKKAPSQFTWPENMPEPYLVVRRVVRLMKFHREVMRYNFAQLYGGAASSLASAVKGSSTRSSSPGLASSMSQAQAVNKIQGRWCCGEDADLFKERWEKLFVEFLDPEKVDPSKISELHDTMKFDAVHNRQFLEWIFTPPPELLEQYLAIEDAAEDRPTTRPRENSVASVRPSQDPEPGISKRPTNKSLGEKSNTPNLAERMGFRRRTGQLDPASIRNSLTGTISEQHFALYTGGGKPRNEAGQEKLRELFNYAKILFDYIGPQEYGIKDSEKLEIGLLTSLPLLRAIVNDLEDMQASEGAKTSIYFTKESHIYTLLNCVIEGGIETKIERNKIPELDYLSTICFELYESQNSMHDETDEAFNYSIRITISPGCHAFEPLDVQLDSKHCIGFAPRRSLTAHNDWKHVIETLRAKFHTVKLPKSFVAVNLAEKAPQAFENPGEGGEGVDSDDAVQVGPESIGGHLLKVRSSKPGFEEGAAGLGFTGLDEPALGVVPSEQQPAAAADDTTLDSVPP
ncbi:hypothetical protein FH972_022137 [Carpinus fangiana]|uniref:Inositol hexakisphosphate and diphosphoinositol-pentakisphosphate kinase n=1 Tax=Carpinus fangiana TaxID=176857 RepID=A0A5N6KRW6_9ROSI|nr:hypothetical protein FH972_022137 [Carpinus fangiana]